LPSSSTSRLRKTLISSDCSATWVVYQNSGKRGRQLQNSENLLCEFFLLRFQPSGQGLDRQAALGVALAAGVPGQD
jgi:hypothetical protein